MSNTKFADRRNSTDSKSNSVAGIGVKAASNRDRAQELLSGRSLVFALNQGQAAIGDIEAFARHAEIAVDCGATHLFVGEIPFQYDNWVLPDPSDPYAAWCNHSLSILRVCPPDELQPWVSIEHAKAVQAHLSQQLEIADKHGLKGVCFAVEPLWLPEEVYRAHPRWRGPQCELGRIARRPYFAPSIDHPEVLALYQAAMCEFAKKFPQVDQFSFLSNDSGAGIAWTPNTYPGMNGPVDYRTRDGGSRIANWLKALQQGARDGGSEVRFNLHSSGFPPELTASARKQLDSGLFVRSGNSHGETFEAAAASLGASMWDVAWPVPGLSSPLSFIAGLQNVYHNPKADDVRVRVGCSPTEIDLMERCLHSYLDDPGAGVVNRMQVALRVAEQIAGTADVSEQLVAVWQQVEKAQHAIAQVRQKGFGLVLPFACVSMRWLTRPFVLRPQELTEDERSHYEPFLFTVGDEDERSRMNMVLGKGVFRGESVMWMARWCLFEAMGTLRNAASQVERMIEQSEDEAGRSRLALYAARIRALACVANTARNAIMYQYALDVADQPQYGPNPMDYDDNIVYDQRALTLRKIAREELDNITELVELLDANPGTLVYAREEQQQSVFMLGPNVAEELRKKMNVMLDHWQDYETDFPATKVWDYEPKPLGNIVEE